MKPTLVLLLAFSLSSAGWAQSIALKEIVGPNHEIHDSVYGISLEYPAAWQVRGAQRWGKNNQENTIAFKPEAPLKAVPSLYYQPTTNFASPAPHEVDAHFRYTAGTKAQQRVNSGLSDYRNIEDTFERITINGRPAFRYTAAYTRQGQVYLEYFVRILGEKTMAMFFIQAPADEMAGVRREVDQMAATIRVP